MECYYYNGPVSYYGKLMANNWRASTMATSKKKAENNIKYQVKSACNLSSGVGGITLHSNVEKI